MSAREKIDVGVDPDGRTIRMTRRMKAALDATSEQCGVTPTIVQGAFMAELGGGASASAGYHDRSGCIDTRTWDLDSDQEQRLIRAARAVGWAVWKRDSAHGGMDEHMHWVLLGEQDMASGACEQERDYLEGRDGLASKGPDYHWRPDPITPFDYDSYLEVWMPTMKELKEELVPVIVNQIMRRDLTKDGMTVATALRQASRAADLKRMLDRLPKEIAKATEAAFPEDRDTLTRAEVRAAAQKGAESAILAVITEAEVEV